MGELLDQIFSLEGPLVKSLKGFEERPGQYEMAKQIFQAYQKKQIALMEAGTGIGKSIAYLIPAILWAIKHQEKTVISTYTIALQEQLLKKDIPALFKALDVDLKAVIVKGMSNYLCLRKLDEVEEEDPDIKKIKVWSEKTKEGSYSDISFPLSLVSWDRVNADEQSCSHVHCPHYKQCFFFKARRQSEDAQIVIVNHHILFADLASKKRKDYREEKAIIPAYKRLVIDEAHHIEEVALESLSNRFDRLNLIRLLGRLYSDLHPERSRLLQLRKALPEGKSTLIAKLEIDLPAEKRVLCEQIENAFTALEAFCRTFFPVKEQRWRLREEHFQNPIIKNDIEPLFDKLSASLKRFIQTLLGIKEEIEKTLPQHAMELQAIATRLEEQAEGLANYFSGEEHLMRVRWAESTASNIALVDAQLDISSYLKDEVFDVLSSVSLCSATLSCAGTFEHLRTRLGIAPELSVTESIYHSPFDYPSNALMTVTSDLPDPSDPTFVKKASAVILQAIEASKGAAFILFTSYEMLKTAYEHLLPFAASSGFLFLKQGDSSRQLLIEKFKTSKKAVLFGTDSFWEGVDIAGDALKLVIIAKLPFKVPTDPLMQAVSEALENEGKNPFMEYQVPQAIMKFKQGFGRLIRTKTDKGVILCLDKRLTTKAYGKLFLQSLPNCRTFIGPQEEVIVEMKKMFGA